MSSWLWSTCIVVMLLGTACGSPEGRATPDEGGETPPTSTATVSGPVRVPDLDGLTGRDAARELRAIGLRLVVHGVDGSGCLPPGVMVQRPRAGRVVALRTRVVVEINTGASRECGIDLPSADAELARVARRFIAFAGGGEVPPFAEEIGLHLGNRLIDSVAESRLADPEIWRICPPEGLYAAFVCPFSARDHVQRWEGRLAITPQAASHPCAHPADPPAAWAALRRVTITPDESLSCPSYWAVELYVDDSDRIAAVNLVRSEP